MTSFPHTQYSVPEFRAGAWVVAATNGARLARYKLNVRPLEVAHAAMAVDKMPSTICADSTTGCVPRLVVSAGRASPRHTLAGSAAEDRPEVGCQIGVKMKWRGHDSWWHQEIQWEKWHNR